MTIAKKKAVNCKTAILVCLVVAGLIAGRTGLIDWDRVLLHAEAAAGLWWAPPAFVAVIAVFYLFALPGSMFFWITGVLYLPMQATFIVTAGGLLGGLSAYAFAQRMAGLPAGRLHTNSTFFRFLERNTDLLTLCAVRTFPFFPHSVINYGAGVLGINVGKFAIATVVGYGVKGFIYASAIQGAAGAKRVSDLVDAAVLTPLLALAGLLLIGRILHRRWISREAKVEQEKDGGAGNR
jgi:uncharacterized membrane protein YdjX (TVP38/TMEM64 family)